VIGATARGSVLSLVAVLAGILILPTALRAVNRLLLDDTVKPSYLPTVETPRPREPFDDEAAAALREAQPEFVVIGDSMAGTRIDPRHLSRTSGRSVAGLFVAGTPVAYWYLEFKNFVAQNHLTRVRGVIFFFRDDQLTVRRQVATPMFDRVARDEEPELDALLAADRLGTFSGVHRAARALYQFDRTRQWLEPRLNHAPAALAGSDGQPEALLSAINAEIFPLEKLRHYEAADLPQADAASLDFYSQLDGSVLPEIVRLAQRSNIRLAFIRVQRRPMADGPPPQSDELTRYLEELKAYLTERGAYYHDDWGDPATPLSTYADGDHIVPAAKVPYTERFLEKHARIFQ